MAPKSIAARGMITAFASIPVHQWNMFSSLSAFLGTPGQANYVAANLQINEVSHQQCGKGTFLKKDVARGGQSLHYIPSRITQLLQMLRYVHRRQHVIRR